MNPAFAKLLKIAAKSERVVVGMISGTSADAIAVAVCRIGGGGVPSPGRPGAVVEGEKGSKAKRGQEPKRESGLRETGCKACARRRGPDLG